MPFLPAIFASTLLGVAVNVGLSFVLRALQPKPKRTPQTRELTGAQADAPWQVVYGPQIVNGTIVYRKLHGANNEFFTLAIVWCYGGPDGVEAIDEIHFGDEVAANGETPISKYSGLLTVQNRLGTDSQSTPSLLTDTGDFTSSDAGFGHCYSVLRLKHDPDKFSDFNEQVVRAKVRGRKVLDTRTGAVAYSANPVLCLRDYLSSTRFGLGYGQGLRGLPVILDDDTTSAEANACDESVAIKAGGTRARYALSFAFQTDSEPGRVAQAMIDSMAGWLNYSGGKWRILAGRWRPPVVTITDEDLRGPVSIDLSLGMLEKVNGVRGTFEEPTKGQRTNYPSYAPADLYAEDGNLRRWTTLDLQAVDVPSQAQQLAKIALGLRRREKRLRLPLKFGKVALQPGDVFRFTHNDWTEKTFVVTTAELLAVRDGDRVSLGVDIAAQEEDFALWFWDPQADETTFAAPGTSAFPSASPSPVVFADSDPTERPTIHPVSWLPSNTGPVTAAVTIASGLETTNTGWQVIATVDFDVPEGATEFTFNMTAGTSGVGSVTLDSGNNIGLAINDPGDAAPSSPQADRAGTGALSIPVSGTQIGIARKLRLYVKSVAGATRSTGTCAQDVRTPLVSTAVA